jgi:hypothetical protein
MKNILNLKINKLAVDTVKKINILSGALNFLSSQFFSFFNLALLGSPDKTAKIF